MVRVILALGLALAWPLASDAQPSVFDASHTHQIALGAATEWLVDSRDQPLPDSFQAEIDHTSGEVFSFHSEGLSETEASPSPFARAWAGIDGSADTGGGGAFLASHADVRATVVYFVDVIAPASQQGTVNVPVLATAYLEADLDWDNQAPNSSTYGSASVNYTYDADGNGAGNFTGSQSAQTRTPSLLPGGVSDYFDHTITVPVPAGGFGTMRASTVAQLRIHVSMNNDPGSPTAAFWQASAFADPFIRVDPTWELADQYELAFSEGVGNLPVPEPSAVFLLVAGAATLVFFDRMRRSTRS